MAIPLTNLHKRRVVEQIWNMLMGLQRGMRDGATAYRSLAVAQSSPVATLKTQMEDAATNVWLVSLQRLIDLLAAPARRQRVLDVMAQMGWTEADLTDVATPLRTAAIAFRDAPKKNYAQIITACDSMLAFIDPPESLWPE